MDGFERHMMTEKIPIFRLTIIIKRIQEPSGQPGTRQNPLRDKDRPAGPASTARRILFKAKTQKAWRQLLV